MYDNCAFHPSLRLASFFDPSVAAFTSDARLTVEVDKFEQAFKFLDEDLRSKMMAEAAQYVKYSQDACKVGESEAKDPAVFYNPNGGKTKLQFHKRKVLSFYQQHRTQIPAWAEAARRVFALSPTSASTERAISVATRSFGSDTGTQDALMDYVGTGVQLQYNESRREREAARQSTTDLEEV